MKAFYRSFRSLAVAAVGSLLFSGPAWAGDNVRRDLTGRAADTSVNETAFPLLPSRLSDLSRSRQVPARSLPEAATDLLDGRDDFRSENRVPSRDTRGVKKPVIPDRNSPLDRTPSAMPDVDEMDPFVPAPVPKDQMDEESLQISETLTLRYQNPVNVRAIRAMTSTQGAALFAEVSKRIDERSLEPTSYDVRVRRALRNLGMALDNEAFMSGLGISANSFQTDAFRESLGRLAGAAPVRSYQDAGRVLNQVVREASRVPGLTAGVVAWEFSLASIDTLDKFSGLEAAEPSSRNGAESVGVRSASLEEEIVGVGVEVREHPEGLLVVKPLRGGPAAEAGLASGDVILSIDGTPLSSMKMAESVDLMKGVSGSRMTLRILRDGRGERDFVLVRRKVRVWTVNDTRILKGTNVAYLSLSRFSQSSTAELDQALNELYKNGMKSLIIDLRGNPGGLLTTCVEISDRFLPCGTIVTTKGRLNSDNMAEQATFAQTWSVPLVVLIDGDSASASEIFAAAMQENRRGVIVGTRSYGKGSVQTHFPLNAIPGDLRITTALFYSPNGRKMAGEGVVPDVEVNDADGMENGDEMLKEALRIATSDSLKQMARASARCRSAVPAAARSTSLENLSDPTSAAVRVF